MDDLEQKVRAVLNAANPKDQARLPRPTQEESDGPIRSSAKKQWHFSVGILLLAIFLLVGSFALPLEDQWMWAGLAVILFLVGSWQFDKANSAFNDFKHEAKHTENN